MCGFVFPETFFILKRTEQDIIITVHSSHARTRYSCQILIKFELSPPQILKKLSNIKFH